MAKTHTGRWETVEKWAQFLNPTCAGLSLGADFEHTLHVYLSFWVWQNEMLQLNFEMLNLTNAAIHYYIGLLHHQSFFKIVENIFLITVGFKTKKVLVSLFSSCRCDFLQTKWNKFRWCFTQLFPNFSLETAISQFRFSSSREGMKSQKETKKALFFITHGRAANVLRITCFLFHKGTTHANLRVKKLISTKPGIPSRNKGLAWVTTQASMTTCGEGGPCNKDNHLNLSKGSEHPKCEISFIEFQSSHFSKSSKSDQKMQGVFEICT